jgi:hypothetical protein
MHAKLRLIKTNWINYYLFSMSNLKNNKMESLAGNALLKMT